MPCFLSYNLNLYWRSHWNPNALGRRFPPVEARTRGESRRPTCRIRRSFPTTLPSELAQCTSNSRSRLDDIDDAAHSKHGYSPFAQHRGLASYGEHSSLQQHPSSDPILCRPLHGHLNRLLPHYLMFENFCKASRLPPVMSLVCNAARPIAERVGPRTSQWAGLSRRYKSTASSRFPGRGRAHYE